MKTVHSLMNDAEIRRQFWIEVAGDPEALSDRGKSKEEALMLANYFEGKYDGLCDANKLND